jgi:hypothetical protein
VKRIVFIKKEEKKETGEEENINEEKWPKEGRRDMVKRILLKKSG